MLKTTEHEMKKTTKEFLRFGNAKIKKGFIGLRKKSI